MAENTVETEVVAGGNNPAAKGADTTRDGSRYLIPAVDIYETEDGLTVEADMPGVARDGVDVRVEDNTLTIRGKVGNGSAKGEFFREYELQDYFRQFKLNERVDQEKISAQLTHGVLKLHLPKAKAAKPHRIAVQVN